MGLIGQGFVTLLAERNYRLGHAGVAPASLFVIEFNWGVVSFNHENVVCLRLPLKICCWSILKFRRRALPL
jgi:hypothetical protein